PVPGGPSGVAIIGLCENFNVSSPGSGSPRLVPANTPPATAANITTVRVLISVSFPKLPDELQLHALWQKQNNRRCTLHWRRRTTTQLQELAATQDRFAF